MAEQQGLPHLLIFPLPLQGPVNSMLKLAEVLCLAGIYITFLVTDHVHSRLLRFTDIQTRFSRYPGRFRLDSISDGLPEDHPRLGHQLMEMFHAWETVTKPLFRRMMTSGDLGPDSQSPVTCIIADGILGFTIDVAKEIGVPVICIRTISPCCLWIFCCLPKLIQAGELRFQETDLDALVSGVPGMEGILRRRDLPTFCRPGNSADPMIQLFSVDDPLRRLTLTPMSFLQASTSTGSGSKLEPLIRHAKAKTRRSCGRGTRGAVVWIHGAGEVALVHLRPREPELNAVFDSGDERKVLRNSVTVNGNWWKRRLEDLSVQVQSCYHNVAPASLLPWSLVLARRYVWQLKSLVSKCLAVVTLVGTEDDWETQASSMEIVCHFIESYSSHSKNSENDSVPVLAAALPSWSLLLTTVDVQRLNNKHWKGVMSYIIELLEVEEKSIFEKGRFETFSSEACTYLFPQEW